MKARKLMTWGMAVLMAASMTACGGSGSADTTAAGTIAAAGTSAGSEAAGTGTEETTASGAAQGADAYADLPEMSLTIASSASSTNITYQVQCDAAQAISDQTGGKLKINVVWDGTLGNDGELVESCMGGSIPMISLASSPLLSYYPEIALFDMPMVFSTREQAYDGLKNFKDTFNSILQEKGMEVLAIGFQQFRGLSTNVNIQKPEDFQGMSIRTMENKYHMAFWENLGAKATPLAFSDLYLSLQQGLVQAQDNPIGGVYASKFYEVQDYFMPITAFPFVAFITMNKEAYDALPAAYQELLVEFADQFMEESYKVMEEDDQHSFELIGDQMTVLDYTQEIQDAMKKAAEPVWNDIRAAVGDELVDEYLKAAEQAAK